MNPSEATSGFGSLGSTFFMLGFLGWIFNLALIIFVISLLWRMTRAQEKIARHLLEIVRDNKRAQHEAMDPVRIVEEKD